MRLSEYSVNFRRIFARFDVNNRIIRIHKVSSDDPVKKSQVRFGKSHLTDYVTFYHLFLMLEKMLKQCYPHIDKMNNNGYNGYNK